MSDQHITLYNSRIGDITLWSDGTVAIEVYEESGNSVLYLSQEETKELYLKMKEFFEAKS